MASTGTLAIAAAPLYPVRASKVGQLSISCSSSFATSTSETTEDEQRTSQKFSYSRALPAVRWPHLKFAAESQYPPPQGQITAAPPSLTKIDSSSTDYEEKKSSLSASDSLQLNDEKLEVLGRPSKTRAKKMTKLALKRAKDWRQRVQNLTDRILLLHSEEFVADVLDDRKVQMTPTDFCFLVKWVGRSSWQRALEVYEWLNLRHWYSPNARMLATILSVLGKANQEILAVQIFDRAEPSVGNTVQVYNAMMGVYARNGQFDKVQRLLNLMRARGCEPDLVSLNTLINARLKSAPMTENLSIELLNEVRKSGIRPDIITYNTLISACSRESNFEEAVKVYNDMEACKCQPDLWTYNAMISVCARCGLSGKAEELFKQIDAKGFFPDAVSYNSLLYAFAREGNLGKVKVISEEMVRKGFGKDEMTYNTIIHMYGKLGQLERSLQIYQEMKSIGQNPDVITYTVLIDALGKANRVAEAANVLKEMLDVGIKPSLRTFSALICGYAKAGKQIEAADTFDLMIKSGIRPDHLAYSVMLDTFLRHNETKKAMRMYCNMIRDGFTPDHSLYIAILKMLKEENKEEAVQKVIDDMQEVCGMNPQIISSILVKGECYESAARMLKFAISCGYDLNRENLLSVLGSYSSSGRHAEARELLEFLREHAPGSYQLITEACIITLCKAQSLDEALDEYNKARGLGCFRMSLIIYESLIQCCEENELFAEVSQLCSDMRFDGVELTNDIYRVIVLTYCKMGFPETANYLIDQAEEKGILLDDVYVYLIEAYGKLKLLNKAERLVGILRQRCNLLDRQIWNSLLQAYASCGYYEKARAAFNTMMRDGPSPTTVSINSLIQALIVDGRLNELYVVIQELQDLGFKISKSSILLMLEAFARVGSIFEVKKIYHGMKAAGYFPSMHIYRIMITLLCRGKRVGDAEGMISEMEEAKFKPDLTIWNAMLKLYTEIGDFKKAAYIYQRLNENEFEPDEETYNTVITMYCRDLRPEEAFTLMQEMRRQGLDPKLDTYKSLISAFGKQQMWEQAEELFEGLLKGGYKLDRSFYHTMMKIYRNTNNHLKAEHLLTIMKEKGVEPTIATMHMLMVSYGSSGEPKEAEKVLNSLKETGANVSTLTYSSVIDAYLKNEDYRIGIQKLIEMKEGGLEPDHRIWTCFIRAASLSDSTSTAMILLNALRDCGFDLVTRLLTEKSDLLVLEVDKYLQKLQPMEDNAAFNFVNALEDLLWALELRATASWVFQLAIKRGIYRHDVFRVADKDWGADLRKLSAGAALVGLTLWLDHMQDASLEGSPLSPKSVVLITGNSEYNMVSLNRTIKAYLWEMGSPFLPCKTRSGLLVAKAHSLRMWLKDSPFCLDLELKNSPSLPALNSMQLIEGCFIRRGLVPAFRDINERLGQVRPKKFARLALLSDEKRDKAIRADIEGMKEKLEKMKRKEGIPKKRKIKRFTKKKFIRRAMISNLEEVSPLERFALK